MTTEQGSAALARLIRWRDVGDGPLGYTAGDTDFANDVKSILAELARVEAEVVRLNDNLASMSFAHTLAEERAEAAYASGFAAGRDAAAKVADDYRSRMKAAVVRNTAAGKPFFTAECKADAGESIAQNIRALTPTASKPTPSGSTPHG